MAVGKKTLYQILGIQRDANQLDIGLGYEKRMAQMQRMVPPDPSASALVQQAYEILSNPARREAYDQQLLTLAEKKAAAEQAAPDFEIGEEEAPKKKLPVAAIVAGVVVLAVILFFVFRSGDAPKHVEPVAEAPKAAPPPPPPPPKVRTAAEILADVAAAGGPLSSYSMSGSTQAIGVAIATEPGTMITTCHGIPAGGKLVVLVGKNQLPADLTITDEALDLCRLSVTGSGVRFLKASTDEAKAGDKIVTVGLNAKGELAAAEGTVKGLRKDPAGNVIEITTPIGATSSGAGVFDAYGRLIGIATAPHAYGAGANVALPASWLTQMRSRTK
jgi:S1-C subfamily serine protease